MPSRSYLYSLRINGPFWLTFSAFAFAVMAVFVRMAGQQDIPGAEITTIRFAFGLAVILLLQASGKAEIRFRRVPLLLLRGVVGGLGILLYFISLAIAKGPEATSLTNSAFLGNSYFIYIPIFAALMLRERMCPGILVMVVIATAGLYFITGANLSHIRTGDIYGFLAGVTSAIGLVFVRELRRTETAASVFTALCVSGLVISVLWARFDTIVMPNTIAWWLLAGIGITGALGQLALTHGMKYTPVGQAGLIQMTTVIYSAAAGIIWFGDPFNLRIMLGAILVLGGGILISLIRGHWIHCE